MKLTEYRQRAAASPQEGTITFCGVDLLDEVLETEIADPPNTAEGVLDDEDFWEAIDLIEDSRKAITTMLRVYCDVIVPARKKTLETLADELKQFIDNYVSHPASTTPSDDDEG